MSKCIHVLSVLLSLAMMVSGCEGGSRGKKDKSDNDVWVELFKRELAKTEKRFFESRYIQKHDDPFYLKEVTPKLLTGVQVDASLKNQIELRRDDYNDSWPVLTEQLQRTQLIFAVTSVMPAYRATIILGKELPSGVDVENAALILQFKTIVERGAVFNGRTQQLDLAPEARAETLDLANRIAVRTLNLIRSASSAVSPTARAQLKTIRNEIRLLNVQAAELAGQPVSVTEEPFIENPLKLWSELQGVYNEIFGILAEVDQVDELRSELGAARSSKQKKLIRTHLDGLVSNLGAKLRRLPALHESEGKLLEKLLFATEKQFLLASALTRKSMP